MQMRWWETEEIATVQSNSVSHFLKVVMQSFCLGIEAVLKTCCVWSDGLESFPRGNSSRSG